MPCIFSEEDFRLAGGWNDIRALQGIRSCPIIACQTVNSIIAFHDPLAIQFAEVLLQGTVVHRGNTLFVHQFL